MKEEQHKFIFERVLFIDDEESDVFISKRLLAAHHFSKDVVVKTSAIQALEYLSKCPVNALPQIIFLDLNMPAMDGFGFLSEYEKLNTAVKSSCKVIVLSNHFSQQEKAQLSANKNIMHCFLKPLEKQDIFQLASELDIKC